MASIQKCLFREFFKVLFLYPHIRQFIRDANPLFKIRHCLYRFFSSFFPGHVKGVNAKTCGHFCIFFQAIFLIKFHYRYKTDGISETMGNMANRRK